MGTLLVPGDRWTGREAQPPAPRRPVPTRVCAYWLSGQKPIYSLRGLTTSPVKQELHCHHLPGTAAHTKELLCPEVLHKSQSYRQMLLPLLAISPNPGGGGLRPPAASLPLTHQYVHPRLPAHVRHCPLPSVSAGTTSARSTHTSHPSYKSCRSYGPFTQRPLQNTFDTQQSNDPPNRYIRRQSRIVYLCGHMRRRYETFMSNQSSLSVSGAARFSAGPQSLPPPGLLGSSLLRLTHGHCDGFLPFLLGWALLMFQSMMMYMKFTSVSGRR